MNYLRIDYEHFPAKAKIYREEVLVNQWSVKEPKKLIDELIDSTDLSGFDKLKMKSTIETVTSIFKPTGIRILDKSNNKE